MYLFQSDDEMVVPIEITPTLRFWLNFINHTDLFINLFGLVNVSMSLFIFLKKPMFHQNLVVLLLSGYISGLIILLCGFLKCIAAVMDFDILAHNSFYPNNNFIWCVEGIRAWGAFSAIFSISSAICERMYATINFRSYEQTNFNQLAVFLIIIFCWISGAHMTLCCFYFQFYMISISILMIILVCTGVGFLIAYHTNLNRLKNAKKQTTNVYILSQRYQLTENIRVFNMLKRCKNGFLICCLTGLAFSAYMLWFTKIASVSAREYIMREGLHIIVCVTCNVISFCCITGIHVWREMFRSYLKQILVCKFGTKRVHQCEETDTSASMRYRISVRNTDGMALTFNAPEETDIYFKQLNLLWT